MDTGKLLLGKPSRFMLQKPGDKLGPKASFSFFFNNTSLAPYSCFKTKDFSYECEPKRCIGIVNQI